MPRFSRKRIPDEWRLLAVKQASCIHREDEVVQDIVREAVCRLSVNSAQQRKRLFAHSQKPTRIFLKDLHILQYLVFYFSETREKAQEAYAPPSSISERDMITRYLASIVRKILKRNSLYAVTGVCRFIFNYPLKDVREIHGAIIDEPDRYRTDDDFRNNKNRMREMIFARFSKHLRLEESRQGQEKHFQLRRDQNDSSLLRLIERNLDAFKPWLTECSYGDFNQHEEWRNMHPHDDEQASETRRLHTLIHPDCLMKLTDRLGFGAPNAKLGIPQFFSIKSNGEVAPDGGPAGPPNSSARGGDDGRGDDSGRASLRDQEEGVLKKVLSEQAEKLDRFKPEGVLKVKIDHNDVATFDLDATNRVEFIVDNEEAELIEVVAEKEKLVLGVHLLDTEVWKSNGGTYSYVARPSYGTKVLFALKGITNANTGGNQLIVTVTYRQIILKRFLLQLWWRLKDQLGNRREVIKSSFRSPPTKDFAPIVGISFLHFIPILIITAVVGHFVFTSSFMQMHRSSPPSDSAKETGSTSTAVSDSAGFNSSTIPVARYTLNIFPTDGTNSHYSVRDQTRTAEKALPKKTFRTRIANLKNESPRPQYGGCQARSL
jgi:hypothetical protein